MRILLNDEIVEVTLENETSLGEVVTGMDEWLKNSGFVITSIIKNGRPLNYGEQSAWMNDPLDEVADLHIYSKFQWEAALDEYQVLLDILTSLDRALKDKDTEKLSMLAKDGDRYFTLLEKTAPATGGPTSPHGLGLLHSLVLNLSENTEISAGDKIEEQVHNLVHLYMVIISERIREISFPLEEFLGIEEMLLRTMEKINDVSMLLQTGKDREAMESIVLFTELSQKAIRLYPLLIQKGFLTREDLRINGKPLPDYYEELNAILSEMLGAFESQDSVLLGDLLEYEISPKIQGLIDFIRKVKL